MFTCTEDRALHALAIAACLGCVAHSAWGCCAQERLASGEDIFGPLIRKFLLDNKHRWAALLLAKCLAGQVGMCDQSSGGTQKCLTDC